MAPPALSPLSRSATDESLLLRIGAADQHALADFYQRHAGTARAVASRWLYEPADAEDVVQDVFLTLWRRPHRFDPERGSGRSWLFTVVRNRSLDHLRRQLPREDVTELADLLPDPRQTDAVDELDAAALGQQLWQQVSCLPPEQGALIQRAYVDGRTHQQISEESGLPLGTVKSRIRLGLEKLRAALRDSMSS